MDILVLDFGGNGGGGVLELAGVIRGAGGGVSSVPPKAARGEYFVLRGALVSNELPRLGERKEGGNRPVSLGVADESGGG